MEAPAIADLPGGRVRYTLRRSPGARSLRIVIHPQRGVVVTVPARRGGSDGAERHAADFLASREAWIRRHLARHERIRSELAALGGARDGGRVRYLGDHHRVRVVAASGSARSAVERVGGAVGDELVIHRGARERRTDAALLEAWLRSRARASIAREIERHAQALGVAPTAVTLRDPRSRWGSASAAGRLSFSWRLILAPPEALETVVVHELAHLRVLGHDARFWALVASRRPDHRTWRRWLHEHAAELHGALG
jgi:predicted metal-dependent hydrolase